MQPTEKKILAMPVPGFMAGQSNPDLLYYVQMSLIVGSMWLAQATVALRAFTALSMAFSGTGRPIAFGSLNPGVFSG